MFIRKSSHIKPRRHIQRRPHGNDDRAARLHRGEELRRVVLAAAQRLERAAGLRHRRQREYQGGECC